MLGGKKIMDRGKSNRMFMTFGAGILMFAAFFLYTANDNSIKEVNTQIEESLKGMNSELNGHVATYERIAGLVADNRALFYKEGLTLPDANYSALSRVLNEKYVNAISVVDKNGMVNGFSHGIKIEKSIEKDDTLYDVMQRGGNEVRTLRKSLFEDKIVLSIMYPVVKTENISFEGMAGVEIDILELFNQIQGKNIKFKGQYFMAVSKEMNVLMINDKDKIGKSVKNFNQIQLYPDKLSGRGSFFDKNPGLFRIMDFPTEDVKVIAFIPISSISTQNIKVVSRKVAYVIGVIILSLIVTKFVRMGQYARNQGKDIKGLRKEIDNFRAREDVKNELIATSLHEIKTPLYAMTGIARSLIEKAALTKETRNSLYLIVTTGKRIANMISNVSDYSGKNIIRPDLKICPINIKEIVDSVFYILNALITGKEITLENAIPEDFPNIMADNEQIEQALINILGNGVKYSHHGVIRVSAENDGKNAKLTFLDNGIGMNPEKLDIVNAALKSPNLNIDPDLGIGLNITKKIIKLHGGEIYMESKLSQGTTVYFTIQIENTEKKVIDNS